MATRARSCRKGSCRGLRRGRPHLARQDSPHIPRGQGRQPLDRADRHGVYGRRHGQDSPTARRMEECRIESAGDMVIHTCRLMRFGTVVSERGTPPPACSTCSARLGSADPAVGVSPGGYSKSAGRPSVVDSDLQPFDRVGLDAASWHICTSSVRRGFAARPLPASLTVVGTGGQGGELASLPASGGGGAAAARDPVGGLGRRRGRDRPDGPRPGRCRQAGRACHVHRRMRRSVGAAAGWRCRPHGRKGAAS